MQSSLAGSLEAPFGVAEGATRALGNHSAFLLTGSAAWEVVSGHVDVFAVRVDANGRPGMRMHLFRLDPRQLFFELGETAEVGEMQLLVTGSTGTRVRPVDVPSLRAHGESDAGAPAVAALLDEWIEALGRAISRDVPPPDCEEFDIGARRVRSLRTVWHGRRIVSWVSQQSGRSLVFGDERLPIEGDVVLPLSRRAWLTTAELGVVSVRDTITVVRDGSAWTAMDRLHAVVRGRIAQLESLTVGAERARLGRSATARSQVFTEALGEIATVVSDGGMRGVTLPVTSDALSPDEALLTVCRLVGDALGVRVQRPPAVHAGERSDPVSAVAKASRLRTRKVVLRERWWCEDGGPLVGFLEGSGRPVALIPNGGKRYVLHEPAYGARPAPVTAATAAALEPFAYAFYRPFPDAAMRLADILSFGFRGCRRDLVTALSMSVATSVLGMLVPMAVGMLFDSIIPGAQRSQLWQLTAILVVAALGSAGFQVTRTVALLRINGRMGATVQAAVWDRLLSLPLTFFRPYTAGDLAMRASGIDAARQIVFGAGMNALLSGVFSLVYVLLLFYYDTTLAWSGVTVIGVAFGVTVYVSLLQLRRQRDVSRLSIKTAGTMLQLVTGISKLRVAGSEVHAFALWARLFSAQRRAQFSVRRTVNAYATFSAALPLVSYGVIFWQVAALLQAGQGMRTGELLAFVAAFSACLTATLASGMAGTQILAALPMYENARPIFEALPEVVGGRSDPGMLTGEIDVQHAVFRYHPDAPLTLREVSFQIKAGEFVALVGPSGSGKSTLLRLLLGFETPESGAIYLDGQDLAGLDVNMVRRQIGVVLQQGRLTTGDIFTNIVGASPATVEEAWQAAQLAGLDTDIRQMPMGMHTVVSEGGGTLSGGQRQRLLIARALVHRPRILLFDEATSALDNRTQAIITRSLDALQATRVVVAHRLSTIQSADRILVFDHGRIVQSGTYAELLEQPGLFAQLARRQLT